MILNQEGRLISPPSWVDFLHTDWERRVRLDVPGTQRDLDKWGLVPVEGLRLVLYQEDATKQGSIDDLVTVGNVFFDGGEQRWVAIIDWEALRHVSELSLPEAAVYREYRPQS